MIEYKVKENIAFFNPVIIDPTKIDLNRKIKDYYIANENKLAFCSKLKEEFVNANYEYLAENIFNTKLSTGKKIVTYINSL